MRLRYVDNAHELIDEHPRLLSKPEQYKENWQALFQQKQPLFVEFGAGKGSFIINLAKQFPEANLLAFERNAKVVFKSIVKLEEEKHENFYIVCADVTNLRDIFSDHTVDRIYLNFSDPWPKDRHAKRRLTHKGFLEKYKEILVHGGEIHFKTDNDALFAFSVNEFKENGWELLVETTDLHNSEFNHGNVMTEYEEKFSSQGKNINKLIAKYIK